MRKILRSRVAAVSIGALVVVGLGAGGATAAGMIDSDNIRNNSVQQQDLGRDSVGKSELKANSVGPRYLTDGLLARIQENARQQGEPGKSAFEIAKESGKTDATTEAEWLDELKGEQGNPGVSGYQVFTSVQDFGPGGIGGAWCGAPDANTEDKGWRVIGGGATLTPEDVNKGVAVVSSWPNLADPLNPGWNVQVNKPLNVNPGQVTLYAVCVQVAD